MKKLILTLTVIVLALVSYQGFARDIGPRPRVNVQKLITEAALANADYIQAKTEIMEQMSWSPIRINEKNPKIVEIGGSYSGGNPQGGNGQTTNFMILFDYHVNMDWNGYTGSIIAVVSYWDYDEFDGFGGRNLHSRGVKVLKILKSQELTFVPATLPRLPLAN